MISATKHAFQTFIKRVSWFPVLWCINDSVVECRQVQGGVVIFDKFSYKFLYKYARGDIALVHAPSDAGSKLVGLLTGLEQDWVSLDGGVLKKVPKGQCMIRLIDPWEGKNHAIVPLALLSGRACCSIGVDLNPKNVCLQNQE